MNKFYFTVLLLLFVDALYAQLDTANITITNYRLHDGTYSWRGTGTYFNRTTFDSSPYIEGHLKHYNGTFRQNFRLLVPKGYDPNYKPGYPIMLVWHGAVERANCFDQDCYHGTRAYNPNNQPIVTDESDIDNLLNNDHQLLHGANRPHIQAWNTAGTMKIDDPGLPVRAFPGFVLFPQNLNGWGTGDVRDAIRTVRLLLKKYNIDPDRVYTHGLSNGGQGLLNALVEAPWLFAAGAPMSAITSNNFRNNASKVAHIPLWFFQGGKDDNPTQGATETTISIFRAAGGDARYTLYPNLGHGTWNTAYAEPDFFTWFLGNIKSDIHIAYGSATICGTNGEAAKLSLPAGFYAYQWERDGVIIEGANSNTYDALIPGVYRARYSRVSATPTEAEWNRWSAKITISEATPAAPELNQIGSIHLRDLNNSNTARLQGPSGFQRYYWYKDGELTTIATTNSSPTINAGTSNINMGTYTLVTAGFDNCPSEPSNPKSVFFSDLAPINIPIPTGFSGTLTAPTTVLLRWNDVSGNERHYEIWRRKSTDAAANGWTFVALTNEDAIIYEDSNLEPGTEYWYKLRAVSNLGRSNYAPGNSKTNPAQNLIINTESDNTPPSAPQNLTAEQYDTDIATKTVSIRLNWSPSSDAGGLKEYDILYGNQSLTIPASQETTYILDSLPLNTSYAFRVVARDISGNVSVPSNQANANTYIDGFFWEHSTAAYTDMRDIPQQLWDEPEFEGRSPNLTLEPALQEEFLVFRFYGYLYITTPGEHQLRIRSNDGVYLYVDGELLARRNGLVTSTDCATTNISGNVPIFLDAGAHTIEVRYFQYTGPKCLYLQWRGPDAASNPTSWRDVPDNRIRSYDSPPVNDIPPPPVDLQAVANGMTQIDLSWNFTGTPPVEYEIYRSTSETGTYTIVSRVSTTAYSDENLLPGTTYYYKLRTVSGTSISEYTDVVNATTELDTEPPTQPTALTLFSKTLTSASIAWTKSEDNTQVIGYEIWVNDVLNTTAPSNFHLITGLEPLRTYTVYVIAYDANGNKSEPSNTITFDTSTPEMFYSKPAGNLNLVETWGKNPDGSGDSPLNFTTNGSFFVLANRANSTVGGSWKVEGTVSKIVIPSGITLTTESPVQGRMEVEDGGTIILANSTIPTFVNLGVNSTVQYNQSAQQIQRVSYGNLILAGTANKTFASGTTSIFGNFQVGNGIVIKGASNNQSTIILYGDLAYSGSPGFTPPDVSLGLELRKNGMQTLGFAGTLNLYHISAGNTTQIAFDNGATPGVISLGSDTGGGLTLTDGSALLLENNTLRLIGRATLNPGGEAGTIHVNEGTIDITSTSPQNSNLFTDPEQNKIFLLRSNLSGTGTLIVQTPVLITDGLKVARGTFNANGNVTLVSNETKTANLQEIENNGSVTGDMNVQRYISQKPRTYRYMSSPVAGIRVSDWQEFFPVTGPFPGTSTGTGLSTQHSLYYREQDGWVGYPSSSFPSPYNDNEAPIEKGKGYAAFIRNTTALLMNSRGVPYQGVVVFDVYPPADGVVESDWNLLGNPYASTITWSNDGNAWAKNQISNIVAVRENFNTTSGQFQYYDATTGLGTGEGGTLAGGRIAPGQAFWVQATGPDPSISISERAKSTGQQDFYREGASALSYLKLNLRQDNKSDQALIILTDFGTDDYDKVFDGLKMSNEGLFNFATITKNGYTVSINNLDDEFCSKSIKLSLKNTAAGTYSVEAESPETLAGVGTLRLLDHFTGKSANLLESGSYSFSVTSDPASYGDDRFEIMLERPALDLTVKANTIIHCTEASQITLTNTQRGASYAILNDDLEQIGDLQTSIGNDITFSVPTEKLGEGNNTFQIQASFKGCSSAIIPEKVILEYYAPPVVTGNDVSVCLGSPADLAVSSTGNVSHYVWYGSDGQIKGVTGAQFTTDPINEERHYLVNAVNPNGCAGPQFILTVTPETLEEPEIIVRGDTLQSSIHGAEYVWMRNDEVVLASSSAYYFMPDEAGTYSLTVKSGGCAQTSRAFVVTSAEGLAGRMGLQLFPNPTTSDNINLKLQADGNGPVRISILDVLGREAYSAIHEHRSSGAVIQIRPDQALKPGVYFLTVEQKSRKGKIKFIIKD